MAKNEEAAESKEVVTKASTEVATYDYGNYGATGYENTDSDDIAVPFLNLLQSNSPQCSDESMPDARPGKFLNSASNELFSGKDGVHFIPALTAHEFVEWVPREKGGGIAARHEVGSRFVEDCMKAAGSRVGKIPTPEGNELIETFYMYGILLGTDPNATTGEACILSFKSMGIGAYKKAMYSLKKTTITRTDGSKIKPPLFAHRIKLTSMADKKDGYDFFRVLIEPSIDRDVKKSLIAPNGPQGHLMAEAEEVLNGFMQGTLKAAEETQTTGAGSAAGDEEVPF